MEDRYEHLKDDPVVCREEAKKLLFAAAPTTQEQNLGIKLLTRAVKLQDPEAMYVMGKMFAEHRLKPLQGGYLENGIRLMQQSAALGYGPAKIYMDNDYSAQSNPKESVFRYSASCTCDYGAIRALTHLALYGKNDPRKRLVFWSCVYGILIILLLPALLKTEWTAQNLGSYIRIGICCCIVPLLHFGLPRLHYSAMGKLKNTVNEYVFLEERLLIQSTGNGTRSEVSVSYASLIKCMETGRYLFLWQSKKQGLIVDKTTFNGGMPQQLREKLCSILGKNYVICNY